MERVRERVLTDLADVGRAAVHGATAVHSTLRGERCDTGAMDARCAPVRQHSATGSASTRRSTPPHRRLRHVRRVGPHPATHQRCPGDRRTVGTEALVLGTLHRDTGETAPRPRGSAAPLRLAYPKSTGPPSSPAGRRSRCRLPVRAPALLAGARDAARGRAGAPRRVALRPAAAPLSRRRYLVVGSGTDPRREAVTDAPSSRPAARCCTSRPIRGRPQTGPNSPGG